MARMMPIPDAGLGWIASPFNGEGNVLVVLRLCGGNDGLNTLVPVHDDEYYRLRRDTSDTDLSIDADKGITIRDDPFHCFHPSLAPLSELYKEGKVAVVRGVGYPNMDLSHFRGTNI